MNQLQLLLDTKYQAYCQLSFIENDPISIPHLYTLQQDIEIAGFFAAILAWGNRTTIINNSKKLMSLMGNTPYDFIVHHSPKDLKPLSDFVHRTFNSTDLMYTILFLKYHYSKQSSLEQAFVTEKNTIEASLIHFHNYFFSLTHFLERTRKHIATPAKKSACKRLNMFLRWMVRKDDSGVDFGLWKKITPAQLICPMDIHVCNVAYRLGLIESTTSNWKNAITLTEVLRTFDKNDPVKYDYALFGLGVMEKFR